MMARGSDNHFGAGGNFYLTWHLLLHTITDQKKLAAALWTATSSYIQLIYTIEQTTPSREPDFSIVWLLNIKAQLRL